GIRDDLVTGVQTCALPIFRLGGRLVVVGGAVAFPSGHRLVGLVRLHGLHAERADAQDGAEEGRSAQQGPGVARYQAPRLTPRTRDRKSVVSGEGRDMREAV